MTENLAIKKKKKKMKRMLTLDKNSDFSKYFQLILQLQNLLCHHEHFTIYG